MRIPYLKGIRKLARGAVVLVCADVAIVLMVSGSYWRIGGAKFHSMPNWTGYKPEQIEKMIADRETLMSSIRRMYELDVTKDSTLIDVIADNCILEDPECRCVGKQEIFKHFKILPQEVQKLQYTDFKPTHHPDKIEIQCSRIEKQMMHSNEMTLRSTLTIEITKEDVPRASSITDEWNSVPLIQPQLHNKYLYSGTIAQFLRRVMAQMHFARYSDKPSLFNIFYWKKEFHKWKREFSSRDPSLDNGTPIARHGSEFTQEKNVFNAGRKSE